MDFPQMKEVLRKCEEFAEGPGMRPVFHITGGDPLLAPDFWALAELLKERSYPFFIMGNPFHIDEKICRMPKECGCIGYQLSLDGMEETHDRFRKPGSFRKTMEMIPVITRSGMYSVVMMTVSDKNYRELPAVMDALEEAGSTTRWHAGPIPRWKKKIS